MAAPATSSIFDVAHWFVERARFEDSYLQAQKLQRLLWLAQGHYAATYHGRKLMPCDIRGDGHRTAGTEYIPGI